MKIKRLLLNYRRAGDITRFWKRVRLTDTPTAAEVMRQFRADGILAFSDGPDLVGTMEVTIHV